MLLLFNKLKLLDGSNLLNFLGKGSCAVHGSELKFLD